MSLGETQALPHLPTPNKRSIPSVRRGLSLVATALVTLFLVSCSGTLETFVDAYRNADILAARGGFEGELVTTPDFTIRTFHRQLIEDENLIIYLEGDGRSFTRYGGITNDPTPRYPVALELAVSDRRNNVIYIARPCQYVIRYALDQNCQYRYWVDERFSAVVVEAINSVIDQFVARTRGRRIHLVGFAGGGAVALLIASRRLDVASILTVSGNLDHVAINSFHSVPQLVGSLNPIDDLDLLRDIPQIHFVGKDDQIVPPFIARGYERRIASDCVAVHEEAGAGHVTGWSQRWPSLLQLIPTCSGSRR